MFSFNPKLSTIMIACILLFGIVTEAFASKDTDITETTPCTLEQESISILENTVEPEAEIVEAAPEYIHSLMKYSYNEEIQSPEETTPEETEPERTWVIDCTDEDYNNLVRIVEAESTGGDLKAKILVANVVINRVKSAVFPNSVTEVVFQGNGQQFSPIADGRFYRVAVRESTVEAVNRALEGEDYSQGATYFASHRSSGAGTWHGTCLKRLFEYGGHVFFTA